MCISTSNPSIIALPEIDYVVLFCPHVLISLGLVHTIVLRSFQGLGLKGSGGLDINAGIPVQSRHNHFTEY